MRKILSGALVLFLGLSANATANDAAKEAVDDKAAVAVDVAAGEFSEVEYYRKLAEKQLAEAIAAEPEPVSYVEPYVEPEPEYIPAPPAPPIAQARVIVEPAPVVYYELPPPLPELSEPVYYYRECPEEAAPPKNVIVAIPQFHRSTVKSGASFDVGGMKLKSGKGHANGASVTLIYNRVFSELLSVAVLYEYAFLNVNSGSAVPADAYDAGLRAHEDSRWRSHVVGVQPELNFGKWGRLTPSLIFGFDRASGTESVFQNGRLAGTSSMNNQGTNVISLMAWYEKDFDLGSGFKLTPYAGWRSLHVDVRPTDENLWVHLISGGLKASYQKGDVGFSLRGGVNHRTTRDDLPAYGNRAVAPGVIQFSHRANQDRTIGTFGAGVNFNIKKRAMVGINYDGYVGKDTTSHTGTLSFALPF